MKKPEPPKTSTRKAQAQPASRLTPVATTVAAPLAFSRPPMPALVARANALRGEAPFARIDDLAVVSAAIAAKIKTAAGLSPTGARAAFAPQSGQAGVHPGTERWPVKTGQDEQRNQVGKNVIDGEDLGQGIVETTVEELGALPRPAGLEVATKDPPQFQDVRDGVGEVTVWRIVANIIAIKHESDGDYHLVVQGDSGAEMVAEVPTPTEAFVGDCPWIEDIARARQAVDDGIVRGLAIADFSLMNGRLLPLSASLTVQRQAAPPGISLLTPPKGSALQQPLFQSAIQPRRARLSGIGFFDRAHGQTGAAPNVIELHPLLKIEWM